MYIGHIISAHHSQAKPILVHPSILQPTKAQLANAIAQITTVQPIIAQSKLLDLLNPETKGM